MRAVQAAALTNFVLILLIVAGLIMTSSSNSAHVYANPVKAIFQAAAIAAARRCAAGDDGRVANMGARSALSDAAGKPLARECSKRVCWVSR